MKRLHLSDRSIPSTIMACNWASQIDASDPKIIAINESLYQFSHAVLNKDCLAQYLEKVACGAAENANTVCYGICPNADLAGELKICSKSFDVPHSNFVQT